MMNNDNIGIALEAHLKHEPVVIAKALRAARSVENVGFCLEHYYAIEQLQPGIFKDINPKMLTQQPSGVKRSVALEVISGSGMIKAIGVGLATGSVVGLFFKLIGWLSDKLSGGKAGSIPSPAEFDKKNKEAFSRLAEVDRKNRELFKATFDDFDAMLDTMSSKHKIDSDTVNKIERSIRVAKSPIELACIIKIAKTVPADNSAEMKAITAMTKFKSDDAIRYSLCHKSGIRGVLSIFEDPILKSIDFRKLQNIAKDLAEALKTADSFISRQSDASLDAFKSQVSRLTDSYKKYDISQDDRAKVSEHASTIYSFYPSTVEFAKEHKSPNMGPLDKLDLTSERYSSIIKDSYVCKNILLDAVRNIKEKKDIEIENKAHSASFKSSLGELQRAATGLFYYTNLADKMNKSFTQVLERYGKS